jgi:hypothetical protein
MKTPEKQMAISNLAIGEQVALAYSVSGIRKSSRDWLCRSFRSFKTGTGPRTLPPSAADPSASGLSPIFSFFP